MEDAESPALGLDLPEEPQKAASTSPYRVLARKYRPQTFAELIGQDAMVQTLANAIKRDRIAHAFLLTGVRGVGKTSTARLIAKALNCVGPDGQRGPTIDPCGVCGPWRAIAHGAGGVTADQVRIMLGLSDGGAIRRLLGLLLGGDAPAALAALRDQYE